VILVGGIPEKEGIDQLERICDDNPALQAAFGIDDGEEFIKGVFKHHELLNILILLDEGNDQEQALCKKRGEGIISKIGRRA